jgi:hypothetical protein
MFSECASVLARLEATVEPTLKRQGLIIGRKAYSIDERHFCGPPYLLHFISLALQPGNTGIDEEE